MGSRRVRVIARLLLVAIFASWTTRAARAEAVGGAAVDLVYVAPPECPTADAFRRALVARVPDALDDTRVFTAVHVALERNTAAGAAISGVLVLVRPDRTSVTRTLEADRCDEVVDGLALMAAIAFENERQAPRPKHETPIAPRQAPERTPARPSPLRMSVGVQGALVGGVTSKSLWTLRSFFDVARASRGIFAPSARIAFESSIPTHLDPSLGDAPGLPGARVHWSAGSLGICPLRLSLASWAGARPCLEGDVGFVSISGPEGGRPRTATKFWAHTAVLARVDAEAPWIIGDRKAGSFFVELEGGLVVPLTRYTVTFGGSKLYTVPAASFQVGAGLGLRF
ncbi:hypothetical protein AKJ09_00513 [Labilithrix luteola]|uniref:Uncharacterized protein n=1 Tax=Labilithrix luteola TaxID=1391654 RepID=A0A0K1PL54_9BACT|nr:hypothetical protein [Labilithrix luteola]AKU93849.1 hypothetical protein AKJ09_00513 [Labilithrix luteola]